MKVVGSHGIRDLIYGCFFALWRARTRLHSRSPHRRFLRSGGPPHASNPSMKHARRICAGVPGRVAGELHGHISIFFRFQNPRNFLNQNFMENEIVKHFLGHTHIAIWVWLFLWHFNAIFLWRPFFGSLDHGKNNQKYLEYSVEKISRSYPYRQTTPTGMTNPGHRSKATEQRSKPLWHSRRMVDGDLGSWF